MSQSKPNQLTPRPRRRRSPWRWLSVPAGLVGVLLVIVYVIGPGVATPIIQEKLDEMVRSQLNARLEMGSVSYDFPYGVNVRNAALVADDPRGGTVKLLEIPHLHIALAELPFRRGPLVVERMVLRRPAVHLIRTDDGMLGRKLIWADDERPTDMRLSEMLQLRLVSIDDGRIVYEDRTKPDTVPAAWRHIDVRLTTSPTTSPVYAFDFTAVSRPLATVAATGTFDIDELYLQAEKVALEFTAAGEHAESPAPAALQQVLEEFGVKGKLRIEAKAQVPLKDLHAARFDARLGLKDATARLPEPEADITELRADVHLSTRPLTAVQELKHTAILMRQGRAPDTRPAEPVADAPERDDGALSAVEELQLTAKLLKDQNGEAADDDGAALTQLRQTALMLYREEPPPATQPTTGPATAPSSPPPAMYVLIEDAAITIGDNRLAVHKAGLTLDWDEMTWRLGPVHANLTLGMEQELLPNAVRKANADLLLEGTADLSMSGHGRLLPGPNGKHDYRLNVRAAAPRVLVTDRKLMFTNVRADIVVSPAGVAFPDNGTTLHGLYGDFHGGAVRATGQVRLQRPVEYAFIVRASGVDMAQFGRAWPMPGEEPLRITGTAFGRMHVHGTGRVGGESAISQLRGFGDFEIRDGEFYDVPVLAQVLNGMNQKASPGTLGHAAGVFDVRQQTVRLNKVAISAPVMGIQGSGKVSFDSDMDLKVVAAPLADWKQNLRQAKVPIVSDVAAELAGGIQKILNTATGKLIYQFRVTGKLGEPRITPQPVPMLTNDMVQVFAHMLRGGDKLLDEIKR